MKQTSLHGLIVDDDVDFVEDFKLLLPKWLSLDWAPSSEQARQMVDAVSYDLILLDICLDEEVNGLEFLKELKHEHPYLPVIMVTGVQEVATVVEALHLGASDYIGKHPEIEKLKISVDRALAENRWKQRYDLIAGELHAKIGELVGESPVMQRIKAEMARIASVNSNVLITGESGTGKELVARGIHQLSERSDRPFVAVNCAALSKDLIESELFGHEKGAFTGASSRRNGKFEVCGDGTLLLDEITEVPVQLQAKLLRVLQEREFERLGGNGLMPFEGRLLATTNRNPQSAVQQGFLREDLLYRLDVTSIHLPPLKDRKEDISLLADHFMRRISSEMKKEVEGLSPGARQMLTAFDWPGNVRQLANCIESAIVHLDGPLLEERHFAHIFPITSSSYRSYKDAEQHYLGEFRRNFIGSALRENDWNVSRTADSIGVTRQWLHKMMDALGISRPEHPT